VGALVIANWSYGLIRDTGAMLVDISPGETLANQVRTAVETAGDRIVDLHVWRLGPAFYHAILRRFSGLSHITVEVHVPQ
jgi:Co/Zn/Cd efflux system component